MLFLTDKNEEIINPKPTMKNKILILLFCFSTCTAFAQNHLAQAEKDNFKTIALSKDPSGVLIIKKWVVPVRYKVYNVSNTYSITEIDSIFAQIKMLTNLDIAPAKTEAEVNFSVFLGGKNDFPNQIPAATSESFSKFGGTYYKFNGKGEIYQAIDLTTIPSFTDQRDVRNALRKSIIRLFGFFNPLENMPTSIFYSQSNNVTAFDAYDSFLIRLLYSPRFTSGMSSAQVDEALAKM